MIACRHRGAVPVNPVCVTTERSKNISTKGPRNCRSLHGTPGQVGFARDDKGESGVSVWDRLLGSQVSKARPRGTPGQAGHPSITPFDIAEGTSFGRRLDEEQ